METPFLTIEGCSCISKPDGTYSVDAHGRIDSDGTGTHYGDPTAQNETTYKPDLNADKDKYVVVPPQFRVKAKGIVMGCKVLVENLANGKSTLAVVGDVGPQTKWGEMSIACAKAIGLPWNPNNGGTDKREIRYTYHPGVPAVVDGKTYKLQKA